MPKEWTGELLRRAHINGVQSREIAKEAGVTPEYFSMVINGHRDPRNAEQKFCEALNRILAAKTT